MKSHNDSGGVKHDAGKLPWDLMPWDALMEVCAVFLFGANKYAPRNWEKGILYSRVWSAAIRHLTDWWNGEDCDKETGYSHLAHAACCILFLLAFKIRRIPDLDDRPNSKKLAGRFDISDTTEVSLQTVVQICGLPVRVSSQTNCVPKLGPLIKYMESIKMRYSLENKKFPPADKDWWISLTHDEPGVFTNPCIVIGSKIWEVVPHDLLPPN